VTADLRESSLPGFSASITCSPEDVCSLVILDPLSSITVDGVPATGRMTLKIGSKLKIGAAFLQLGIKVPSLATVEEPIDADSSNEAYVPPFAITAPVVEIAEPQKQKRSVLPLFAVVAVLVGVVCFAVLARKRPSSTLPVGAQQGSVIVQRTELPFNSSQSRAVNAVCQYCGGSGQFTCTVCGGTGLTGQEKKANFVDPNGTIHSYTLDKAKCRNCGGTGRITCPVCDGKGTLSEEAKAAKRQTLDSEISKREFDAKNLVEQMSLAGANSQGYVSLVRAQLQELQGELQVLQKERMCVNP